MLHVSPWEAAGSNVDVWSKVRAETMKLRWNSRTLLLHWYLNRSHYSCTVKHKLVNTWTFACCCTRHWRWKLLLQNCGHLTCAPLCIPGCTKINAYHWSTLKCSQGVWGCWMVRRERCESESIWWKRRTALVMAEHILQEITFISTNRTLLSKSKTASASTSTILQARWMGPKHYSWLLATAAVGQM